MKNLNTICNQKTHSRHGWMLLFVLGISLSHAVPNNTYAQSPPTAPPALSTLITPPAVIERLLARVSEQGTVMIIVGLKLDGYEPEGYLLPEVAKIQRQAIADAQNRLSVRMSLYGIESVVKFQYIPFIAMTVDEITLKALTIDPEVNTIEENIAIPLATTPISY